jgi:hypothetical protein
VTAVEVGLADLRIGDLMAEGGEGRVHLMPLQPQHVLKLYRRPADAEFLQRLVEWPDSLPEERAVTVRAASAWPSAVVRSQEQEGAGLLVPRAPRRFTVRHRDGHSRLASLSYLTADPAHRAAAYGLVLPPVAGPERVGIVYALARLLAAFEAGRPMVSHGDLSTKNVLWSLQRGPEVYVIDCDSAELFDPDGRRSSGPGRRRAMTPNWDDPAVPPGQDPSWATDRYSLALIFLRVVGGANFPIQARQRTGGRLEVRFPVPPGPGADVLLDERAAVWNLCARALSLQGERPAAADWLGPLEALLQAMGAASTTRGVWAAHGGGAASPIRPQPALGESEVLIIPERAAAQEKTWNKVAPTVRYGSGEGAPRQPATTGYRYVSVSRAPANRVQPASAQPSASPPPSWVRPPTLNQPWLAQSRAAPPGAAPPSGPPSPRMGAGTAPPVWPEVREQLLRFLVWWLDIHRDLWSTVRGRRKGRPLASVLTCVGVDFTVLVLVTVAVSLAVSPILEG